ncbi:hypothetical protein MsAg5_03110 [Methanosarcinaceae archaeon Ag5]|uniref:Insecticide toxin TcdB middle/N-terminal domain-containing protein n=1 Tax=Methanolapillus africanus TaxID=3028297 RepID=A0AAE4MH22_9EURY|nr:hypothetical protein [Methanosarcinaceae archaeon Ag5]
MNFKKNVKKIIIVCIALMILTPTFAFAAESDSGSSGSDSGAGSSGDNVPSSGTPSDSSANDLSSGKESDSKPESSESKNLSDQSESDQNLEENESESKQLEESLAEEEENMVMAAAATNNTTPEINISSYTSPEVDFGLTNDAYLTSLFSGAAVYSYPIQVPKGIAGFEPKVEIVYNSQGAGRTYGWLGDGWQLNDNYIQRDVNFTPLNTSDDKFKLTFDGQSYDLIYNATEGRYHTEIESFFFIQKEIGASNQKGDYWILKTKDGTTYRFGYTMDSELMNSVTGRDYAVRWSLDQIEDVNGNLIVYNYVENPVTGEIGASYLKNITYNNGDVVIDFERTAKSVTFNQFKDGTQVLEKSLLSKISIWNKEELVYRYEIEYNTADNRLFLKSIQLVGMDEESLPETSFEYNTGPRSYVSSNLVLPTYLIVNENRDMGVQIVDINGDGLPDIMQSTYLYPPGGPTYIDINTWINNGTAFVKNTTWNSPVYFTTHYDGANHWQGVQIVDINGDGLPDIVQAAHFKNNANPTKKTWINTGSGFVLDSNWSLPTVFLSNEQDTGVRIVDLNGDGLPDIVESYYASLPYYTHNVKRAWINNGNGFTADNSWATSLPHFSVGGHDQGVRFVDINGDGLPDLVHSYINSGPNSNTRINNVYINNGTGFKYDSSWQIPSWIIHYGEDYGFRFGDVNGDGLPDVIHSYRYATSSSSYTNFKYISINTGSGFVQDPNINPPGYTNWRSGVEIADINGDGLSDFIQSSYVQSAQTFIRKSTVVMSPSSPNLLTQIHHSAGSTTKIEYDVSTKYNNTQENGKPGLSVPIRVVKKIETDNGMTGDQRTVSTINYDYKGGLMVIKPKGESEFRGFKQVTVNDGRSVAEHYFHQDEAKKGKEYQLIQKSISGVLYSKTENIFDAANDSGVYTVLLNTSTKYLYDGKTTPIVTETEYSYDSYGNVVRIFNKGDVSVAGDEKTAIMDYVYNTDSWILNCVKREKVEGLNFEKLSERTFYYDGNAHLETEPTKGLVTKAIVWNSLGQDVVNEFGYDSYGNLISQKDGEGHVKTVEYDYDFSAVYPISTTNALGQTTTFDFNLILGKIQKMTDPNGFETFMDYDGLGRVTRIVRPYDTLNSPSVQYEYFIGESMPKYIKVSVKESESSGYFDSWKYLDGFGRVIKTETESVDVLENIIQETYYDNYGAVSKIIAPKKNGELTLETVNSYDSFGRIIQTTNPDGTTRRMEYDQLKTTYFDERSNKIQMDKDVYGNIVRVTEFNSNEIYETGYEYDLMNRLTKIIPMQNYAVSTISFSDETGSESVSYPYAYRVQNTTFAYNSLGQQIEINDPDIGIWKYDYDKNGNLISKTDNRSITTSYEYDALNRKTKIDYPTDSDVIFEYDLGTIGTLSSVTSEGATKYYSYDQRLRVVKEGISISSEGTQSRVQSMSVRSMVIEPEILEPSVFNSTSVRSFGSKSIQSDSVDLITHEVITSEPSVYNSTNRSHLFGSTMEVNNIESATVFDSIDSNSIDTIVIDSQISMTSATGSDVVTGSFENKEDITIQLSRDESVVQELNLTNLRVSMGAGDVGRIYLNGKEVLRFTDTAAGGTLQILNENGVSLGTIQSINGNPSYENVTFNISFKAEPSERTIQIDKYSRGTFVGTYNYSYATNEPLSNMRAYLYGYQSNVNYITSGYKIVYDSVTGPGTDPEPENSTTFYVNDSFVNVNDITVPLVRDDAVLKELDLKTYRSSMGAGDSSYFYLNGKEILRFVDSGSGGTLYIKDENGTQIGVIQRVNGKPTAEGVTFDISFKDDGPVRNILIKKYEKTGALNGTYSYSYATNESVSVMRANIIGYQTGVDYVSSEYNVLYELINIPVDPDPEDPDPEIPDPEDPDPEDPDPEDPDEPEIPDSWQDPFEYNADYTTKYVYDSMDRITKKTLPNDEVVKYRYNNQALLSSIPGVVDNIEYNSMNLITKKEFSNGVTTDLTYDGWTKRLQNINTPDLQDLDYSFDEKGNIIEIADNVVGETQQFGYDDLDRLTTAGSETYSQQFVYNPLGSILGHKNGTDITLFEYGNGAGIHAPTKVGDSNLLYDSNGNLVEDETFVYVYNDANHLKEVVKKSEDRVIAEFFYDESGNRVKKIEEGIVSYYVTDDYEIEDNEEVVYYFADGRRVAKESSEGRFWYLDDHLGSTSVMIDENGELVERTLYYPFGSHREGGTEKYSFTGKEFDSEIGLYYYGARYYNPETFVFTQADSIIPDVYNPQALNRYSYCLNNPLKYEDPDGHNYLYAGLVAGVAVFTLACTIVGAGAYAYESYKQQVAETGTYDGKEVFKAGVRGALEGGTFGLVTSGTVAVGIAAATAEAPAGAVLLSACAAGASLSVVGGIGSRTIDGVMEGQSLSEIGTSALHIDYLATDAVNGFVSPIGIAESLISEESMGTINVSQSLNSGKEYFNQNYGDPAHNKLDNFSNSSKEKWEPNNQKYKENKEKFNKNRKLGR